MHPQSELENYKLQVELLQEKLHRSEDNRQQLEGKLEHIMKKRNEHEKTLRSRSHRKYQQFLDEQKKRNERNRKLVDMLEQIDQQAAALSARSERLKMMKLQYELYFSKIVQSYSMKTLQNIPTIPLLPIQRQPNAAYAMHKTDDVVSASYNNNSPQFQTVPIPVVVPIPNEQNRFHRSWAFAAAPPGVLITLANNSTFPSTDIGNNSKNDSNLSFDYSQFPIGYLQNPTATSPMQCNVGQPYLQQTQQSKPTENNSKPLLTPDENVKQHLKFRDQIPTSFPFADSETNETILNKAPQDLSQKIFELHMDKPMKNDEFGISEDKGNTAEPKIVHTAKISNNDSSGLCQSLKVDELSNINPNNSLQQETEDGRVVSRGNKPNTIDFRTDDDDYIKYIKEMKETYEKGDSIPLNMPPQEHTIDNITTTLQIQKIDEINVKDDEKINDVEDNEKNTSSAFPPLGGKYSIEKIGDEALTKTPLENHPEESTTNTLAGSIHPSRDTEQITLFNGTKNSKDERTGASNRTAAIIDGGSKNISPENVSSRDRRLETSYRPMHFDKKEKMTIENIETAIYGELLTKSEILPPSDLLDQPKSETAGIAIKETSQEPNQFKDISNDVYEFQQNPVSNQQGDSYQVEQNQGEAQNEVAETNSSNYNYTDINNDIQEQNPEYDMQNYNYSNLPQEYKETNEEVPQQEYQYAGGEQQPQGENYVADYQNYDASQYQSEYDPNTYQYDYEQQQYDDPNQTKYTPEMYNQEYQQDPYSTEYSNYEQKAPYEVDPSNQQYTEQQYMSTVEEQNPLEKTIEQIEQIEQIESVEPAEPVEPIEAAEQNVPLEQEVIDTQVDTPKQNYSNPSEHTPNEEVVNQKATVPTSILSTEKHTDLATKKKKRVNFVDSESDESSILPKPETVSSESDFDFSATQ